MENYGLNNLQVGQTRGHLIGACIADLHFSAYNPKEQYDTLTEQFTKVIMNYPKLDYILIAGDIYDHKLMGNSDGLLYASMFVNDLVYIAKMKGSTIIMIHGTFSHDADQLKNFYHYLNDKELDMRIITSIQMITVKGARMLCIPELYGIDESIYNEYLHYSGYYDFAFLHGTFEGAVYGNNVGNGRLFTFHDFDMCRGFMVGGHVHTPGCHKGYFYYTGSPYRWKFGEEEEKGFLTTILDLDTYRHYVQFNPIKCRTYITIDMETLISNDPKDIINYINNLQINQGIDFLKVKFRTPIKGADKVIIDNYYRNNGKTFVEFLDVMEERRIKDRENGVISEEYDFILDSQLSDFEKFVRYVNLKEGGEFITVDKLRQLLEDKI